MLAELSSQPQGRVLLADPDMTTATRLNAVLAARGHGLIHEPDQEQALNKLHELVSELDMVLIGHDENQDGLALLGRIRGQYPKLPVVMLAKDLDGKGSVRALRLKALDVFNKPLLDADMDAVCSALKELLHDVDAKLEPAKFEEQIEIALPGKLEMVRGVVTAVCQRLEPAFRRHGVSENNIRLCVHEALLNAIVHGNLEISSDIRENAPEHFDNLINEREADMRYASRSVYLTCRITQSALEIEIEDQGQGFNPNSLPLGEQLDEFGLSGRGILLIQTLVDEVSWNRKGNRIRMVKYH